MANIIFRELSKESDIPQKTLSRWWYEREQKQKKFKEELLKNEQGEQGVEFVEESEEEPATAATICITCNENEVYTDPRRGKPYAKGSKTYGLCGSCRGKHRRAEEKRRKENECVCETCGHEHQRKGVEK